MGGASDRKAWVVVATAGLKGECQPLCFFMYSISMELMLNRNSKPDALPQEFCVNEKSRKEGQTKPTDLETNEAVLHDVLIDY